MGNLCSSPSTSHNDIRSPHSGNAIPPAKPSTPGPTHPLRSPVPQSAGRTLGGGGGIPAGTGSGISNADPGDARANAAAAAQKRAEASSTANRGKLGSKLAAQRAQTHAQTLNEASRSERAARDADGAAAARRWE